MRYCCGMKRKCSFTPSRTMVLSQTYLFQINTPL